MGALWQDVRYAVRSLLASPGLTAAAVLSLGLGIGANTTIFTWVQAALLRPIPEATDPDQLFVAAQETRAGQSRSWSYPNYRDIRDGARQFAIIAQDDFPASVAVDGRGERAFAGLVTGNYFQVLGVGAAVGRVLTPEDDVKPGGHPVVVLGHSYWQRRFGGDPAIVGREVTINSIPMTVVGVAQAGFIGAFLGLQSAAFVPMAMQPQMTGVDRLEARGTSWMQALVRLAPGVSREAAQSELAALFRQLEQDHPDANDGRRVRLVRAWDATFGAPSVLAPILGVLSVVVALVLVIACANVANLLLSRAVGRRREIAVRVSLGASRGRLIRQLLTESLVLSLTAGAIGFGMVYWTSGLLMAFVPPVDLPIDLGLRVDAGVFTFAVVTSMLTGLVFGLAPAWQASRPDTVHALKEEGGRGSGGRLGQRLRNGLVVAQLAVCLVLLVAAGLFLRSLWAAPLLDPGFTAQGQLTASINLFPNGYTPETGRQFQRRLIETVAALPSVQTATLSTRTPLGIGGTSSVGVEIDGYAPSRTEDLTIVYEIVAPRYFETMRIAFVGGRDFAVTDTPDVERVLIVNETMARRYWPDGDALGGRVRQGSTSYRVVGIVHDIKYRSLTEAPSAHMYFALDQRYTDEVRLFARTTGDPAQLLGSVREAVRMLDPALPLFDVRTLTQHVEMALFPQRMGANLLALMGALALLLAAIGLYGVMSYAVSQRTREIGVRLALGAEPRRLWQMVVGQGMRLAGLGLGIGLIAAYGVTSLMASLLPGITPHDLVTYAVVPLGLAAIALVAAWLPARRASQTDPVVALRYE